MKVHDAWPPALFIMGPTASGKTDLAVGLTQRFPVDIISVDSAMVYRDMDIGTAKPDAETQRIAPHRLIDIVDPAEAYSAARFRAEALAEMKRCVAGGRVPLLVGGTMLYYRALQQGLSDMPAADPALRLRLQAELAASGSARMHARLAEVDPVAARRIHPNDPQRIQRALEVYMLTGRCLTELYESVKDEVFPFRIFKLILAPADRHLLHRRIERRFQEMLDRGLVAEVEALYGRGDLGLDKPSMRAVGYRQIWEYLDGLTDYDEMVQRGVAATRQFAKRQLTWLRSEDDAIWLDSLAPDIVDQAFNRLRAIRFFSERK